MRRVCPGDRRMRDFAMRYRGELIDLIESAAIGQYASRVFNTLTLSLLSTLSTLSRTSFVPAREAIRA